VSLEWLEPVKGVKGASRREIMHLEAESGEAARSWVRALSTLLMEGRDETKLFLPKPSKSRSIARTIK
jgi:hypothetical protein